MAEEISLFFNDTNATFAGDKMSVGLGPPILQWTPSKALDEGFCTNVYHVLTYWIELETSAIVSRRFGIFRKVDWKTNKMPRVDQRPAILQGPEDLPAILHQLHAAYESAFLLATLDLVGSNNDDLRFGLLSIREFIRRNGGVDPDPHGVVVRLMMHRAKEKQKQAQQDAESGADSASEPPAS